MLRIVHPAREGQGTRPPRRPSPNALTHDERRNLCQALKNLRLRFGSWSCLAEVMDISEATLSSAATGRGRGSPGLALRAARAAGSTVEAILSGKLTPAGSCPLCGASAERRAS